MGPQRGEATGRSQRSTLLRKARRAILQTLYEVDASGHAPDECLDRMAQEGQLIPETVEFARRLVAGVVASRDSLDQDIQAHAPLWPVSQLPLVDRNILRLAVFELQDGQTPHRVVINEAVELAKRFGGESSPRFVNGVLGAVMATRGDGPAQAPRAKEVNGAHGV